MSIVLELPTIHIVLYDLQGLMVSIHFAGMSTDMDELPIQLQLCRSIGLFILLQSPTGKSNWSNVASLLLPSQ